MAEFKKNSAKWRSQVQAADALKQEFADIFADAPTPDQGGAAADPSDAEGGKLKKKRRRKEADVSLEGAACLHSHMTLSSGSGVRMRVRD